MTGSNRLICAVNLVIALLLLATLVASTSAPPITPIIEGLP